ncbi:hypothetical protein T07_7816 [Trichinella nelsoni]|uniref:Uncharacterized protein n=1 Tax=Trichinella nelsoni TaxID=6336 RepID=A0A0V0RAW7_9BILA|nr:hypothetical protein T07_7816 [Trichinella nelsoni]
MSIGNFCKVIEKLLASLETKLSVLLMNSILELILQHSSPREYKC